MEKARVRMELYTNDELSQSVEIVGVKSDAYNIFALGELIEQALLGLGYHPKSVEELFTGE